MRRHRRFARMQRVVAVLVLLVASLLAAASTAQAWPQRPDGWGHPARHVTTISYADARTAWTGCDGVLWVTFDAKDIVGGQQMLVHDDRHVTVLLHDYSGRLQWPGHVGSWLTTADYGVLDKGGRPTGFVSGGDSTVRWAGYLDATTIGGAHIDKAAVRRGEITSTAVAIEDRCTP